jgi:hypothetical protein
LILIPALAIENCGYHRFTDGLVLGIYVELDLVLPANHVAH